MPEEAGGRLDHRIARLVFGAEGPAATPRYSSEDAAADRLVAQLEREGLRCALSRFGGSWYCVWWRADGPSAPPQRLATGSAATRALAICRAVLNLRPESLPRLPEAIPEPLLDAALVR
jgi:hypothetical protein